MPQDNGQENWLQERNERRQAGGTPPHGAHEIAERREDDEQTIDRPEDRDRDRDVGQFTNQGSPGLQKR